MKVIITFGQIHVHRVNGVTFDKDSVAVITAENEYEARCIAFNMFDAHFCTSYTEEEFDREGMIKWYPRGKFNAN